jgi:hypothetical protein
MSNISLYVLLFSISLIHSSFLNYFWFDFNSLVNWNFEFTKVIFFNILSSLTIIFFLIESFLKKEIIKIYYKKILFFTISISILSTTFSISPFISLFWNQEKAHSLIFILNLIWIFIVLTNKKKHELDKFLKIYLISIFIVCIIWIKEYYFPSLNYQDDFNKAVSSFWNNSFLALSILLLIPLILKKYTLKYKFLYLFLLLFCLLLTKSLIAIIIFVIYLFFYFFWKNKWFIFSFLFILFWLSIIFLYFPEKLHSFLSRFYIWQNVISLYLSNFKNILFWYWFETLNLIFTKEKNPYLYIFENYWFIADRSHNLWLDILYSTWIIWFILSIYTSFQILKLTKNTYYFDIFIIFFIFCFFNFAWVSHYLFLILILALFIKNENIKLSLYNFNIKYIPFIISITIISINIYIIIFSTRFYIAEMHYKSWNLEKAINTFCYPKYYFEVWDFKKWLKYYDFPPIIYYQIMILKDDKNNLITNCNKLVSIYNIAENYIWCWNLMEKENYKKESLDFYKRWLSKLPNLWDKNSIYYNNFFVKYTISWNRFLSEKYWNLKQIIDLTK